MKKRIIVSVLTLTLVFFTVGTFSAMAAEKPKMGGHIKFAHRFPSGVIGNPLKIRAWNPHYITNTLQTLIKINNDGTEILPVVAETWELAADKSHYIFKLRKGVKFHDGTPFDARAAKWNLDKWVNSKRARLDNVTSVEVLDDVTIKANIKAWDAITLQDFTQQVFMISPTAFEKNGEEWANFNPVGTGPFKMVDLKRNTHLKFDKFEDYWAEGEPYLDKMTILLIKDPMTSLAALKNKDIDAVMIADGTAVVEATAAGMDVQGVYALYKMLQFNSEDPNSVWADKRMRMALEYAIDKDAVVEASQRGFARSVYTCLHSAPVDPGTVPRKYDPARAKELVAEAGHTGVKVKMYFQFDPNQQLTVTAYQSMLKAAGIDMMPAPVSGAKWQEILHKPVLPGDLIYGSNHGSKAEALSAADQNFGRGAVFFKGTKKPDGFQDLIELALQQDNREKITDILMKAEKMAYDDAMVVPILQLQLNTIQQPYVKDAVWNRAGKPAPDLSRAWLDK